MIDTIFEYIKIGLGYGLKIGIFTTLIAYGINYAFRLFKI